jgi:hypothetical protein
MLLVDAVAPDLILHCMSVYRDGTEGWLARQQELERTVATLRRLNRRLRVLRQRTLPQLFLRALVTTLAVCTGLGLMFLLFVVMVIGLCGGVAHVD